MKPIPHVLYLVTVQLLAAALVAAVENEIWGHWGPVLPALSTMVVSTVWLGDQFKKNKALIDQRMPLYLQTSIVQGSVIFVAQLIGGNTGIWITMVLAIGGGIGVWICCACAGDLALSIVGPAEKKEPPQSGHFRDWPTFRDE